MEEKKNNPKHAIDCDAAIQTAQFRFALIAPLVQGLVPDGSDTARRSSFLKGRISPSVPRIKMKTAAQSGRTTSLSIIRRSGVETDVHGLLRPFLQSF